MSETQTRGTTATTERNDRPVIYQAIPLPDHVQEWVDAACEVVRYEGRGRPSREDVARILPRVTNILTSNQMKIDNDLIRDNPQLLVIANMGVGYDNVDIP